MDRLKILCSKGYFLKELPSVFRTVSFGESVRKIIDEWAANGTIPQNYSKPDKLGKVKATLAEGFSVPKGAHERRIMHVTHPIPQALLSHVISRNWHTVNTWLSKSVFSLDSASITENSERAIKDLDFATHQLRKELITSAADWTVKSDITRFYPSIYTHSIPWAVYGKEYVKKNRRKVEGSLADQLDILTRKSNRDQTVGIPIGPDTSRIISELISASVDQEMMDTAKLSLDEADRLQDDWHIGCSSFEKAELCLANLRNAYQKLGLDINGNKTSIEHLRDQKIVPWRAVLRPFLKNSSRLQGEQLKDFLDSAISLQNSYPAQRILKYVLTILMRHEVRDDDLPYLESFLLKAVICDPIVTQDVCTLFLNLINEKRAVQTERIIKRFKPFIEKALESQNSYEACWGLYLLRGLKVDAGLETIAQLAEDYEGAVIPLILLDMQSKGLTTTLPKRTWEKAVKQSDLMDYNWLLGYEGARYRWLNLGTTFLRHPLLAPLKRHDVVFYDASRTVATREAINKKRLKKVEEQKKIFKIYINRFIDMDRYGQDLDYSGEY